MKLFFLFLCVILVTSFVNALGVSPSTFVLNEKETKKDLLIINNDERPMKIAIESDMQSILVYPKELFLKPQEKILVHVTVPQNIKKGKVIIKEQGTKNKINLLQGIIISIERRNEVKTQNLFQFTNSNTFLLKIAAGILVLLIITGYTINKNKTKIKAILSYVVKFK